MAKGEYEETEVEGEITNKGRFPEAVGVNGEGWLTFKNATEELKAKYEEIEEGDFVKAKAAAQKGAKTHHIKELVEHKKGERTPTIPQGDNGAEEASEEPKEVVAEVVSSIKTLTPVHRIEGIEPFVYPIVDVDKIVNAFAKFKEIKTKVLEDEDFSYIDKTGKWSKEKPKGEANQYIEKTGWQKIALAFSLDIELVSKEKAFGTDKNGKYYVWSYIYRISHPSGKFVITEGSCSSRDPFFSKSRGSIVDPNESDIQHTAQTVCINRGVSIMVGGGVSADEIRRGRDELGA
ncbi:MAG: hypothetical protein KKB31_03595 [Nanoarchaeota archaeon]|nr:hypothetical protein [Nanoarchaeota archaeon]